MKTEAILTALHKTEDLKTVTRQLHGKNVTVLYLESMCDNKKLSAILENFNPRQPEEELAVVRRKSPAKVEDCVDALLQGNCVILSEEDGEAFIFECQAQHQRAIQEPTTEKVLQGIHIGFVEDLNTNLYFLRSMLPLPDVTVKYYELGALPVTVAMIYRDGAVDPSLIQEMNRRLTSIPKDAALNPGLLEEWIEDSPRSLFPHILKTERPDRVVAQLYKEKIALLLKGSPLCVVMPADFLEFFHTTDDYNLRWVAASAFRVLRFFAFLIATILPAVYIAVVAFHSEVIPFELTLRVKTALEGIPYPPLVEALLISVAIELIIEAGIRMPTVLGQIIGIVGGLVIGDAVVKAGLVSNVMVITIAITTISSFIVPGVELNHAVRLLRLAISFLAAILGFYGVMFGVLFLFIHMCRLTSLTVPFMRFTAPFTAKTIMSRVLRSHAKTPRLGKKRV